MNSENATPDDFMKHLHRIVIRDDAADADDCHMTETVIAWAMNETDADQSRNVRAHVIDCRRCLELTLDVRASLEDARSYDGPAPQIHPSVLHAAAQPKTVQPLRMHWLNAFRNRIAELFQFRMALATAAAACLLIVAYHWRAAPPEPQFAFSVYANYGGMTTRGASEFELRSGDPAAGTHFRIRMTLGQSGYVYLVRVDAAGHPRLLFSGKSDAAEIRIPADDSYGFRFDPVSGRQTLYVMVSAREIPGVEQKLLQTETPDTDTLKQLFPGAAVRSFDMFF